MKDIPPSRPTSRFSVTTSFSCTVDSAFAFLMVVAINVSIILLPGELAVVLLIILKIPAVSQYTLF